ncbi:hypothetical protein RIR_jg16807.t1 [Rhizophagus irregularis DAOM 181602=DAOM 197198]|nr:hypothetical protein RIR_jg16807.t1 [Rhizophagus irregularis DAOM 181602=DAOM 197198]
MIRTDQIITARSFSIFTPLAVNSTRKVKIIFKYMYAENLETECVENEYMMTRLCFAKIIINYDKITFSRNFLRSRNKSAKESVMYLLSNSFRIRGKYCRKEGGWESEAEDLCDRKPKY